MYVNVEKLIEALEAEFANAVKYGYDTIELSTAKSFLINILSKQEPAHVVGLDEYLDIYWKLQRLECEQSNKRYIQSIDFDNLPPIGGFHD